MGKKRLSARKGGGLELRLRPMSHDSIVKAMFSRPGLCLDLLRLCLPPPLLAVLADRPPEPVDKTFFNGNMQARYGDVVLKVFVKPGGDGDYFHFLLEHKSAADWAIHIQLATYHVGLMRRQFEDHDGGGRGFRFRPIVKWVLYNGPSPWPVPRRAAGQTRVYGPDKKVAQSCSDYGLMDLRQTPVDRLAPGFRRLSACLTALRGNLQASDSKQPHRQQQGLPPEPSTEELLALIMTGLQGKKGLAIQVLGYILANWQLNKAEWVAVEDAVAKLLGKQRGEIAMGTYSEHIVEKVKPQIFAEGMAKGKAEGMTEGGAKVLIQILEGRFGTLPGDASTLIMEASVDDISLWTGRVLTAPTLDAVLNGKGNVRPASPTNGGP